MLKSTLEAFKNLLAWLIKSQIFNSSCCRGGSAYILMLVLCKSATFLDNCVLRLCMCTSSFVYSSTFLSLWNWNLYQNWLYNCHKIQHVIQCSLAIPQVARSVHQWQRTPTGSGKASWGVGRRQEGKEKAEIGRCRRTDQCWDGVGISGSGAANLLFLFLALIHEPCWILDGCPPHNWQVRDWSYGEK